MFYISTSDYNYTRDENKVLTALNYVAFTTVGPQVGRRGLFPNTRYTETFRNTIYEVTGFHDWVSAQLSGCPVVTNPEQWGLIKQPCTEGVCGNPEKGRFKATPEPGTSVDRQTPDSDVNVSDVSCDGKLV